MLKKSMIVLLTIAALACFSGCANNFAGRLTGTSVKSFVYTVKDDGSCTIHIECKQNQGVLQQLLQ